jgi:hypothetical protein
MKAAYLGLALAASLLVGCEDHDYVRPNTTQEQFKKDLAACQRQVDSITERDRNIDSDINSTVGAQAHNMNQGNTLLRQQMDARKTENRADHLMENCMSARGYAPASRAKQATPPAKS